jgi:hypothetical protein
MAMNYEPSEADIRINRLWSQVGRLQQDLAEAMGERKAELQDQIDGLKTQAIKLECPWAMKNNGHNNGGNHGP